MLNIGVPLTGQVNRVSSARFERRLERQSRFQNDILFTRFVCRQSAWIVATMAGIDHNNLLFWWQRCHSHLARLWHLPYPESGAAVDVDRCIPVETVRRYANKVDDKPMAWIGHGRPNIQRAGHSHSIGQMKRDSLRGDLIGRHRARRWRRIGSVADPEIVKIDRNGPHACITDRKNAVRQFAIGGQRDSGVLACAIDADLVDLGREGVADHAHKKADDKKKCSKHLAHSLLDIRLIA